jgi:beta-phosphoglucomutase-like phosphatase (HAD superfamily)
MRKCEIEQELIDKLKNIRALFLDFDGTIADTETLHFRSYKKLFEQRGKTLDFEFFKTLVGKPRDAGYGLLKSELNIEFDDDSFEDEKTAVFYELLEDGGLQPYQIIKDILFVYFPDTPAYIVSSQNAKLINHLLKVWELSDRFLAVYTTNGAPSKEGAIRAILEAELYAPQSVAFLDDVRENLITAKKLGLCCVGIKDAYNEKTLKSADADILISV